MRYLTAQMIADAINRAPNPIFDAHDVERSVLRFHAVETANEIVAQARSGDPLKCFSAVLAKYVDGTFGGLAGQIRRTSKTHSPNLGGETSPNQQWEKLVTPIVAPPNGQEVEEYDADAPDDDFDRRAIHASAMRNAAARASEEP